MRLGHGQRRSVLILWAWTAILSGIVLYPTYTSRGNAVGADRGRPAHARVALYTVLPPGRRAGPRLVAVQDADRTAGTGGGLTIVSPAELAVRNGTAARLRKHSQARRAPRALAG